MAHLWNPLVTVQQLEERLVQNELPPELQDSIRYHTARLTQAAGILLQLPQAIVAQAVVILYRFWSVEDILKDEFSDVSAASLYLTAKISASPRSMRSLANTYHYLLSTHATFTTPPSAASKPTTPPPDLYLLDSAYQTFRTTLLHLEGQITYTLGFDFHVSLPHPLAVTYLQALDVFSSSSSIPESQSTRLAARAIEHLNTALLAPQQVFLTHQPPSLAVAAVYLAAREVGVRLPQCEWWEVFDVEREELGFLCLVMGSLEGWVRNENEVWGREVGVLRRADVRTQRRKRDVGENGEREDEVERMMREMDERVPA